MLDAERLPDCAFNMYLTRDRNSPMIRCLCFFFKKYDQVFILGTKTVTSDYLNQVLNGSYGICQVSI